MGRDEDATFEIQRFAERLLPEFEGVGVDYRREAVIENDLLETHVANRNKEQIGGLFRWKH